MEQELKINARGLSAPGPRMMVENALSRGSCRSMRVVVSTAAALDDLLEFLTERNAESKVDQVGEEFHVFIEFKT